MTSSKLHGLRSVDVRWRGSDGCIPVRAGSSDSGCNRCLSFCWPRHVVQSWFWISPLYRLDHSVLFVGCFQVCGGETAEDCLSLCLSTSSAVCFSILFFTFCLSSWSPSLIFQTDVFLRRIFHHTECVRSGLCRCCSAPRLALWVSDSC